MNTRSALRNAQRQAAPGGAVRVIQAVVTILFQSPIVIKQLV